MLQQDSWLGVGIKNYLEAQGTRMQFNHEKVIRVCSRKRFSTMSESSACCILYVQWQEKVGEPFGNTWISE